MRLLVRVNFAPIVEAPVIPRTSQKHTQPKTRLSISYVLALVGLGVLVGIVMFIFFGNSGNNSFQTVSNIQYIQQMQSNAVQDIAGEFMCPCGSCSDPTDECTCDHKNGALEVKSFIAQKLREGHKKPHIVEMLLENYSGLKIKKDTSFKFEAPGLH